VSSARIAALLASEITPSGKASKIAALSRRGWFALAFKALEAGAAVVQWYQLPRGAMLARKSKAKPILVAAGQLDFSTAGTKTVKLRLTTAGKRLLRNAKRLKLIARGSFRPSGKSPIIVTRSFVLRP
jgi:hypothetical protein